MRGSTRRTLILKDGLLIGLCTTLFPNTYYSVYPRNLSFIHNIENFKSYIWGINVYEELLREPNLCKENLIAIRELMAGGDTKSSAIHGGMCSHPSPFCY